jgi:hypothetical protein
LSLPVESADFKCVQISAILTLAAHGKKMNLRVGWNVMTNYRIAILSTAMSPTETCTLGAGFSATVQLNMMHHEPEKHTHTMYKYHIFTVQLTCHLSSKAGMKVI